MGSFLLSYETCKRIFYGDSGDDGVPSQNKEMALPVSFCVVYGQLKGKEIDHGTTLVTTAHCGGLGYCLNLGLQALLRC